MEGQQRSLEELLASTPRFDDDGFTEALMARLPARRPSLRMRAGIPLVSTLVSCGLVAGVPGARRLLAEMGFLFVDGLGAAGSSLLAIGAVAAILVWGAVAVTISET